MKANNNSNSKVTLKLNINVRKAITLASNKIIEIELIEYSADWSNFPNSLKLKCHLTYDSAHTLAPNIEQHTLLIKQVQQCFLKQGIKFRDFRKNITFVYADKEADKA